MSPAPIKSSYWRRAKASEFLATLEAEPFWTAPAGRPRRFPFHIILLALKSVAENIDITISGTFIGDAVERLVIFTNPPEPELPKVIYKI